MRTCLALFCALAFFASPFLASPFFFAYLEAERLLEWRDTGYRWFDPWFPLVMILSSCVVALALPRIVGWFGDDEDARL